MGADARSISNSALSAACIPASSLFNLTTEIYQRFIQNNLGKWLFKWIESVRSVQFETESNSWN